MTNKSRTLYMVREDIGNGNGSKQLGARLRCRIDANRVAKILRRAGRDVFLAPVLISASKFDDKGRSIAF